MGDEKSQMVILRRVDDKAMSSADVVKAVRESSDTRVLDESEQSLLLSGQIETVTEITDNIEGWESYPMETTPMPDTRPKVLKPPKQTPAPTLKPRSRKAKPSDPKTDKT